MSGSEGFLSRWSRRKAESAEDREVSPGGPTPGPAEAKPDGSPASPEASEPAVGAFDPASLPSIESVAAGADIRAFLQSGVPAELARTALRTAWATDPTIRDFIGIAENQWDFNDPNAMPGFGPLRADDGATLAAQTRGRARDRFSQIANASVSTPPAMPEASSARGGAPVNKLRQKPAASAEGLADSDTAGLAKQQDKGNNAGGHDDALEESGAQQNHRSHGRALPR
jgi:Protein of unknown function (DUF3306)